MKRNISVTYSIISQESAENGEFDSFGFILEPSETESLSSAVDYLFSTRTSEVDGIESTHGEYHNGRLTYIVSNGMEYRTGEQEERCLHIHNITQSSANRLLRVLREY